MRGFWKTVLSLAVVFLIALFIYLFFVAGPTYLLGRFATLVAWICSILIAVAAVTIVTNPLRKTVMWSYLADLLILGIWALSIQLFFAQGPSSIFGAYAGVVRIVCFAVIAIAAAVTIVRWAIHAARKSTHAVSDSRIASISKPQQSDGSDTKADAVVEVGSAAAQVSPTVEGAIDGGQAMETNAVVEADPAVDADSSAGMDMETEEPKAAEVVSGEQFEPWQPSAASTTPNAEAQDDATKQEGWGAWDAWDAAAVAAPVAASAAPAIAAVAAADASQATDVIQRADIDDAAVDDAPATTSSNQAADAMPKADALEEVAAAAPVVAAIPQIASEPVVAAPEAAAPSPSATPAVSAPQTQASQMFADDSLDMDLDKAGVLDLLDANQLMRFVAGGLIDEGYQVKKVKDRDKGRTAGGRAAKWLATVPQMMIAKRKDAKAAVFCFKQPGILGDVVVDHAFREGKGLDCNAVVIATTGSYSDAARRYASKRNITLWDGDDLQDFI